MKKTKITAVLIAAMLTLSACGNGSTTTVDKESANTTTTTTAANVQDADKPATTTTTATTEATTSVAETTEATTTTEAPPPTPKYPITVKLDETIQKVTTFSNGKAAILYRDYTVSLIDEVGNVTNTNLYFEYASNIRSVSDGIFMAGNNAFDTEGKNITDRFLNSDGEELLDINPQYVLIGIYDENTNNILGVKDHNGNWILK